MPAPGFMYLLHLCCCCCCCCCVNDWLVQSKPPFRDNRASHRADVNDQSHSSSPPVCLRRRSRIKQCVTLPPLHIQQIPGHRNLEIPATAALSRRWSRFKFLTHSQPFIKTAFNDIAEGVSSRLMVSDFFL